MILDAQSFKTVLTPEAALGMVQKAVAQRGWKQFDISDVKLVYTPYWVFSFDVLAGEASPTGKTALNAYTGELNDYIPYLLERPTKKATQTEPGAEVEVLPTAISKSELNEVAATKVAAHAGLKREMVSISAATKYYIPSYQVWVDVANDSFKIDIDAVLGNPQGAEAIPQRAKGLGEAAGETVQKMKTPSGWAELLGKTVGAVSGAAAGKGGSGPQALQTPWVRYLLLALVVLALAYFVFFRTSTQGSVSCSLFDRYYNPPEWFGLFGAKTIRPSVNEKGKLRVEGQCFFSNPGKEDIPSIIALVKINDAAGSTVAQNSSFVGLLAPTGSSQTQKTFEIIWEGSRSKRYLFDYCRIENCK
ncbi:MAG: hypothetical protein QXR53_02875 [Candidatus Norongarragalinales archaeon]